MDSDPGSSSPARKRTSTACEACRSTKIRCQPSEQPGVCKKCLASKRECISRTGPRLRRLRRASAAPSQSPPAAGPSSTFTIDFPATVRAEVDNNFETLRDEHAHFVDRLLPQDGAALWTSTRGADLQTPPPSSSTPSHAINDFHGKPLFNLASAESLLQSFRSMLRYCPCVVLPDDATVPSLAATRPFVLLAILAAASGSRTLQGHSLYDDEFRKVLGLKFVAGDERSLELLQGILIYCAWFPFHLRPKSKQGTQYLRMAADLVQELELDQEPVFRTDVLSDPGVARQQLDGIRAYLGYVYVVTTHTISWKGKKPTLVSFASRTTSSCDILERHAQSEDDLMLVTLFRLSGILYEASEVIHEWHDQPDEHRRLVLTGLEHQFLELQVRIPLCAARTVPVILSTMFINIYLDGGALLKLPRATYPQRSAQGPLPPTLSGLQDCTPKLRGFLDHFAKLDEGTFTGFTLNDWTSFTLTVILALRLSFTVPECPEFDPLWARPRLQFEHFLSRMCRETDLTSASKKVDVLSASRVVLGVVKGKYQARLRGEREAPAAPPPRAKKICPMLDGSLDQYFPLWDPELRPMAMAQPADESTGVAGKPYFHDIWATMAMGWPHNESSFWEQGTRPQ